MRDVPYLRSVREERALSQRDLAARSSVAHDTIGQLERGERKARPSTIRKLAEALGVRPSILLAETEAAAKLEMDKPRANTKPWWGRGPVLSEADILPIGGYDEMNVGEISQKLDSLSEDELQVVRDYERSNKNRGSLIEQLNASLSQDTRPQQRREWRDQNWREWEDQNRREWEELRRREAEWKAAGKWAEYYVVGKAACIPESALVGFEENQKKREAAKNLLASQNEEEYLRRTLSLPKGSQGEELAITWLKLDSGDLREIVEVAQKLIPLARITVETLRERQASFEAIPDRYLKDPASQRRVEELRTALHQYRKEVFEVVHELQELHVEALGKLDEAVDEMRKEGDELAVLTHRADI